MNPLGRSVRALLVVMMAPLAASAAAPAWTNLAPLPDREGFAYPFSGVHNGALLVAGGANFPGKKIGRAHV